MTQIQQMLKSILVTQPLVATCYSRHTKGLRVMVVMMISHWFFDDDFRWIFYDCDDDFEADDCNEL